MLNDTELALLNEINQRVTRTESRMVQLGDYVGTNLRVRMRITVHQEDDPVWVEIDALDVSLSRIVTELREQGVKANLSVPVKWNGRAVAMVYT